MPTTVKTTAKPLDSLTLDDMVKAVNVSRNTRDADRWTALEWLKLYAAYKASDFDITPDDWSADQVEAALTRGIAPTFDD